MKTAYRSLALLLSLVAGCGTAAEPTADGGLDLPETTSGDTSVPMDTVSLADVAALADIVADAPPEGGCDAAMCGAACVDLTSDPHNCGRCGHDCTSLSGVVASSVRCLAGSCDTSGACLPTRTHCSTNPDDGCEVDVTVPDHCGGCMTHCTEPVPLCSLVVDATGARRYSCVSGCAGVASSRCGMSCVDLASDPAHCGSCVTACNPPANGSATCAAGSCRTGCNAGYHLCGMSCADNHAPATCGPSCTACAAPANGIATCDGTTCGFTCAAGFHLCGSACQSNSSPASCGTSCTACAAPANGTATCDGSSCGFTCNVGYHRCGSSCVSDTSVTTCGASCSPCATPANGSASCNGSACGVTCNAGFHACGGTCVSSSATATCGTACVPCPVMVGASATCIAGTCGYACATGYADCNGSGSDGCEASILTSSTNCGGCGTMCGTGATCVSGTCRCSGTLSLCSGSCVDTTTSTTNCGSCGRACGSGQGCAAGTCTAPCFTDDFTRADSSSVGNGWSVVGEYVGTTSCGASCSQRASISGNALAISESGSLTFGCGCPRPPFVARSLPHGFPVTLRVDYTATRDMRVVTTLGLATNTTGGGLTGIEINRSSASYSNSGIALSRNGVYVQSISAPIQWTNASPIRLTVTINADGSMSGSAVQGGTTVPISAGAGTLPSGLDFAILSDSGNVSYDYFSTTMSVLFDNFAACP